MLAFALLVIGVAAGWILRPVLESRLQQLLRLNPSSSAISVLTGPTLTNRLNSAIAEIEGQLGQGFDRDRNATRLQILREVRGDD